MSTPLQNAVERAEAAEAENANWREQMDGENEALREAKAEVVRLREELDDAIASREARRGALIHRAKAAEGRVSERDDRIEALEDRLRWERKHLLKPCVDALSELIASFDDVVMENGGEGSDYPSQNRAQAALNGVACSVGEL